MKRTVLCVIILLTLFLLKTSAFSTVSIDGGGTYIIDYWIKSDTLDIDRNTPQAQTHVILTSEGRVDREVYCNGLSKFTLDGGYIGGYLRYMNNSTGVIQSGTVERLIPSEESTVVINNVEIKELLLTWGESQVVVNGGSYGFEPSIGYQRGIMATENTLITINGGSIKNLLAGNRDNGPYDMSTIKVFGGDFKLNGLAINKGQYYASDFTPDSLGYIGVLSGTLANGDLINAGVYIYDGACLHLIPEPTTLSLLALGAFLAGRKKRI